ncbi:MAG: hypothetical protein KC733_02770 [Candidatus Omnitrophica bacterium]|nr:hypothetical protein [Candidatus Omnitrophota bacterium]
MKNKFLIKLSFLLIFLVTSICLVQGDTILLNSGQSVKGTIIKRSDDSIKIETDLGLDITYFTEEIKSINGKEVQNQTETKKIAEPHILSETHAPSETSTSQFQKTFQDAEKILEPLKEQSKKLENALEEVSADLPEQIENFKEEFSQQFDVQREKILSKVEDLEYEDRIQTFLKMYPENFWKLMFFCWLLSCFPLMRIANLLQSDHSWLAWLPGFHFFLIINMGERSKAWFFLLILPLLLLGASFLLTIEAAPKIFLLGVVLFSFNTFVIPIILWLSIVEKLQRPKIIGLFMSVPIVNIILIYYIAFNFKSFTPKKIIKTKREKSVPGRF